MPQARTGEPDLTVLVPTRNEAGNVEALLARLGAACADLRLQVIFVDDSDDETPAVIAAARSTERLDVQLLHRPPGERHGGLSGAVVAGVELADAPWVVVMDGDLQHPPETVPALLATARTGRYDLVVASRHGSDGSRAGLDGSSRKAVSTGASAIAKAMFPRRLRGISDPMSGFFLVRRDVLAPAELRPLGFKILIEIAVRSGRLRVTEVPFHFGPRLTGQSKASLAEGARFFRHMCRLRADVALAQLAARPGTATGTVWGRLARAVAFGLVGVSGIGVNVAALWLLSLHLLHLNYIVAAALATQVSTAWNFALTDAFVFRGSKRGTRLSRGVPFFLMNNAALLLRLPLLTLFVEWLGIHLLVANVLTLVLLFAVRFGVSDRLIYAQGGIMLGKRQTRGLVAVSESAVEAPVGLVEPELVAPPAAEQVVVLPEQPGPTDAALAPVPARPSRLNNRPSYFKHKYDVHGLVRIGSQVPLRELRYFMTPQMAQTPFDIELRVGPVGSGMLRRRATTTQLRTPFGVQYEEHLGRLGANFHVELGDPIKVTVGPLLAQSPHVVYTNVIEALLRFVLVSHGRMLLHSACVELDGHGVLLSARTDTGKTGTILRLLREQEACFLSDDMTILAPNGLATSFPKPLTISQHTLRAVNVDELAPAEWRRLRVQSRLHSKEGRGIGMLLGQLNVPIMSVNSLTQRLIPPPKYAVDRLIPCDIIAHTQVEELFVIAREPLALTPMTREQALETLIENTDDAYQFPPFRTFAPALVIGDDDYEVLRRKERDILSAALCGVRARGLSTPDYSWADRIPTLLDRSESGNRSGNLSGNLSASNGATPATMTGLPATMAGS